MCIERNKEYSDHNTNSRHTAVTQAALNLQNNLTVDERKQIERDNHYGTCRNSYHLDFTVVNQGGTPPNFVTRYNLKDEGEPIEEQSLRIRIDILRLDNQAIENLNSLGYAFSPLAEGAIMDIAQLHLYGEFANSNPKELVSGIFRTLHTQLPTIIAKNNGVNVKFILCISHLINPITKILKRQTELPIVSKEVPETFMYTQNAYSALYADETVIGEKYLAKHPVIGLANRKKRINPTASLIIPLFDIPSQ